MKNAIIAVLVLALAAAVYYLWKGKKNNGQSNTVVDDSPSLGIHHANMDEVAPGNQHLAIR